MRLWGSVGFMIASLLSGTFWLKDDLFLLPYLFAGLMILSGLIIFSLPDVQGRERMDWIEGLKLLPEHPKLVVFFVGDGVGGRCYLNFFTIPAYLYGPYSCRWMDYGERGRASGTN